MLEFDEIGTPRYLFPSGFWVINCIFRVLCVARGKELAGQASFVSPDLRNIYRWNCCLFWVIGRGSLWFIGCIVFDASRI